MSNKKKTAKLITNAGRRDRNRKIAIQIGVAAVLVALIAAIGVSIAAKKSDKDEAAAAEAAAAAPPAILTKDGKLRLGNQSAKVVVAIDEDFQCPACQNFEAISGQTVTDLVNSGKVAVDYNPIAFLDSKTNQRYSSRSANASICVAEADKAKWPAWHKSMFDKQPPEAGGTGLTDEQLVAIAKEAGITAPETATCITSEKYRSFVAANTKKAVEGGLEHTPSIKVNGTVVESPTPDALQAAVTKAAGVGN